MDLVKDALRDAGSLQDIARPAEVLRHEARGDHQDDRRQVALLNAHIFGIDVGLSFIAYLFDHTFPERLRLRMVPSAILLRCLLLSRQVASVGVSDHDAIPDSHALPIGGRRYPR